MDEYGNIKLEYFEKDKLVYTIPEKNNAKNEASGSTQIGDKRPGEKNRSDYKTTPNSVHEEGLKKVSKGFKMLPALSKQLK